MDERDILDILQKYTDNLVEPESKLYEDLGFSSFKMMLLLGEIGKTYHIMIRYKQLASCVTAEDFIRIVTNGENANLTSTNTNFETGDYP